MTKPTVRIWRTIYPAQYDLCSDQRSYRIHFEFSAPVLFPLRDLSGWICTGANEPKTHWDWSFDATDEDSYDLDHFDQAPSDVLYDLWNRSSAIKLRFVSDEPVLFRTDPRPWFDENVDMDESNRLWLVNRMTVLDERIAAKQSEIKEIESEKKSVAVWLADLEEAPA